MTIDANLMEGIRIGSGFGALLGLAGSYVMRVLNEASRTRQVFAGCPFCPTIEVVSEDVSLLWHQHRREQSDTVTGDVVFNVELRLRSTKKEARAVYVKGSK